MACGTHLSCGIPIERGGHPSEVGASDKGKVVLGGVGGFRLWSLLDETTPSRHHHRQWTSQLGSAPVTHLPGDKGVEVCWALATVVSTSLQKGAQQMMRIKTPKQ